MKKWLWAACVLVACTPSNGGGLFQQGKSVSKQKGLTPYAVTESTENYFVSLKQEPYYALVLAEKIKVNGVEKSEHLLGLKNGTDYTVGIQNGAIVYITAKQVASLLNDYPLGNVAETPNSSQFYKFCYLKAVEERCTGYILDNGMMMYASLTEDYPILQPFSKVGAVNFIEETGAGVAVFTSRNEFRKVLQDLK